MNKLIFPIKAALVSTFGALTMLFAVLAGLSFSYYQDEYGTSIEFSQDYIVLLLASLVMFIYFLGLIFEKDSKFGFYGSLIASTSLLSFYPLGVYFKNVFKHKYVLELAVLKLKIHRETYLAFGLLFFVFILRLEICLRSSFRSEHF